MAPEELLVTPGAPEELLGALVGVLLASSGGQKTGDSLMLASSGCQKRGIRSCWPLLVARRHRICSYVGLFWCCPVFSSLRNYFLGSHFARFCLLVLLLGCLAGVMVWHPSRIHIMLSYIYRRVGYLVRIILMKNVKNIGCP